MSDIWAPPKLNNSDGKPRRVGVEIEFGGLNVRTTSALVADVFGGTREVCSAHRHMVTGTPIGDFEIELDARLVHPGAEADDFERETKRVIGDLSTGLVPTEIVGPPAGIDSLSQFDTLIEKLRDAGAEGTSQGLTYAFGVHLNPEAPSLAAADILRILRAYLLMSPLLRRRIDVDTMRRMLPYVDPFPAKYSRHVINPDYAPDMDALIDDYIADNPTRNRELDMLPLFAHIDEDRVRSQLDDPLIQARPTYHYRLPNTNLAKPDWGIVKEWNRWVMVERIAYDEDRLAHLTAEFMRRNPEDFLARVSVRLAEWFDDFGR